MDRTHASVLRAGRQLNSEGAPRSIVIVWPQSSYRPAACGSNGEQRTADHARRARAEAGWLVGQRGGAAELGASGRDASGTSRSAALALGPFDPEGRLTGRDLPCRLHSMEHRAATELSASDFKARLSSVLDQVAQSGGEVVITRQGRPVARLVPATVARRTERGAWRGLVRVKGDIVHGDWSGDFEASR
jgi:prevent-host-death family protein